MRINFSYEHNSRKNILLIKIKRLIKLFYDTVNILVVKLIVAVCNIASTMKIKHA